MRLIFLGNLPLALAVGVAGILFCSYQYYREFQPQTTGVQHSRWRFILPVLRSLAVLLTAVTIAQPTWSSQHHSSQPGKLEFLIDASESMRLTDTLSPASSSLSSIDSEPQATASPTRYNRATKSLGQQHGLLRQLAEEATLSVRRTGDVATDLLWHSTPLSTAWPTELSKLENHWRSTQTSPQLSQPPTSDAKQHTSATRNEDDSYSVGPWEPSKWSPTSPLGDRLLDSMQSLNANTETSAKQSSENSPGAVILFSDGQANSGTELAIVAEELKKSGRKLFAVGFGATRELADVGIVRIDAPDQVFHSNVVRGKIAIRDLLTSGTPLHVSIAAGNTQLWQTTLRASGKGYREVEFTFPAQDVLDALPSPNPSAADQASVAASLQVSVQSQQSESTFANNSAPLHLTIDTQESRVLLIDGRSRWETRYLRNLFSRDTAWQMDACILTGSDPAQHGNNFPKQRDALMRYDLIILGDIPASRIAPSRLTWIHDFVIRGGGLLLIDGPREHLHSAGFAPLDELMPVDWTITGSNSAATSKLKRNAQLEPAAITLPAFDLLASPTDSGQSLNSDANSEFWTELPSLNFSAQATARSGSEVLVSLANPIDKTPLFVTRRFGAGRVLYLSSDETWRWRYKTGDAVHGRLWNQIARWLQKKPVRVRNEFLSLNTTPAHSQIGHPVEVHCSLRDSTGAPATGRTVIATLRSTLGASDRTFPMEPVIDVPGEYAIDVRNLPAGDYVASVQVDGFPAHMLDLKSPFSVRPPESSELENLTCNTVALKHLAESTGGAYLHESDIDRLPELLGDYRGGKIEQQLTQFWASYFWFGLILVLLSAEWFLRKRLSLI